jgi:hypothetical protein
MNPGNPYRHGQTTVKGLAQISEENQRLHQLAQRTAALMKQMTGHDWITYMDRWKNFDEEAAAQWLIRKYGEQ